MGLINLIDNFPNKCELSGLMADFCQISWRRMAFQSGRRPNGEKSLLAHKMASIRKTVFGILPSQQWQKIEYAKTTGNAPILPDNMAQHEKRGDRHRKTHGTCNELHIRLKCLYRLVQLSCLFLVGGRQYLCLMITGELRVPWEERGDCRFEASSTCRIMPPA